MIKGIIYFLSMLIFVELFLVFFYLHQNKATQYKVKKKIVFIENMIMSTTNSDEKSVRKMSRKLKRFGEKSKINRIALVLFLKENKQYFKQFDLERYYEIINDSGIYNYIERYLLSAKSYEKAYGIWLAGKLNLKIFEAYIIDCFFIPNGVVQLNVIKSLLLLEVSMTDIEHLIQENRQLVLPEGTIRELLSGRNEINKTKERV